MYKISTGLKGGICDLFIYFGIDKPAVIFGLLIGDTVLHFFWVRSTQTLEDLFARLSLHIYTKSSEEIEEVVGG